MRDNSCDKIAPWVHEARGADSADLNTEVNAAVGKHNTALTYQFKAQITRDGHCRLDAVLRMSATLYNAALQERRDAHRMANVSVSRYDQCKAFTDVRGDDPAWAALDVQVGRSALFRVDRAYQSFFRRVKAGGAPGFPRFKAARRYRCIELNDAHSRGWLAVNGDRAQVRIKGLPTFRLRLHRSLPDGQPRVVRITRKARGVYVDLVYGHDNPPVSGALPTKPIGIDLGVAKRVTLSDGTSVAGVEIDRRRLRRLQRRVSRARRRSNGRRSKTAALAREWQRVSDAERGKVHQLTTAIVQAYDFVAVEDLRIPNMTRSAAGTPDAPGRNVAAKRGLNRNILSQSWGRVLSQLEYKAASAGVPLVRVNPAHTSQGCAACGAVDKGSRHGQSFRCRHCGHAADADVNAAINILRRGLQAAFGPTVPVPARTARCHQPRPLGPVCA